MLRTENPQVFSKKEIVFARTSPQHKLEIGMMATFHQCTQYLLTMTVSVKHAQAVGHIVGV